ncbi:MAG: hypothetical protein WA175_11460 [Candidatus Acidiferrales bacterium]
MRLSVKGLAVAAGLLWGAAILCLGLINLALPFYGRSFLEGISSVYPFFHATRTLGDVLIGGLDGLVDGAVAGLLFAWLYNWSARCGDAHRAG